MKKIYFNKPLREGTLIGLDLATKSGYAVINVTPKTIQLVSYGSLKIERHPNEIVRLQNTADYICKILYPYIADDKLNLVTIENCFLAKWNPRTFGFLSRLSGYVTSSIYHSFRDSTGEKVKRGDIKLIPPGTAKKVVGLKGNCNKIEVVKFVNEILKEELFQEVHNNIADAIMLALAGGLK